MRFNGLETAMAWSRSHRDKDPGNNVFLTKHVLGESMDPADSSQSKRNPSSQGMIIIPDFFYETGTVPISRVRIPAQEA